MAPDADDPHGTRPTLARPKHVTDLVPATRYALVVVEGPDSGLTFALDGTEPSRVLIGQSLACDMRLSDRQVSRRHLALSAAEDRLSAIDLGSTNGTSVSGVRIVEALVRPGDVIRLGDTAIRIDVVAPSTSVPLSRATHFGRVVGASPAMRRLYPLCERLASTNVPVIIEGETGTGKELLAEALHEQGPRASGPFVVFDCTAVPPNLVESDLFGHERGAFTGADQLRKGVFEQAHGGTLLIDEIGDLDIALQPKLLRVLERSEIRRVGGSQPLRVDVRVLAATRRDLDHEVQVGRFRDDLFHRLAIARIELPPLRKRRGDIPLLVRALAAQSSAGDLVPEHVLLRWEDASWPGNVRELRNAVTRYLAFGDLAQVSERGRSTGPDAETPRGGGVLETILDMKLPYSAARQRLLDEFERGFVERVMADHDGNVLRAAAASGIARRHFQRVKARTQR